ncbi:hypothetical protein [Halosimplex marinum]|uniref:hypothetical protein n=1 Tax=Halosimplex marinum TaxID=3396620 RepID=UPI003F5564D8
MRDSDPSTAGSDRGEFANWFLLEGNRLSVAACVVATAAAALAVVVIAFGPATLRRGSPVYFLFSSLLTGDLTLVTVVLSINQLVLSRELGSPGSLRSTLDETVEFRRDAADATGTPAAPSEPSAFLRSLHESLAARSRDLRTAAGDAAEADLRRRLRSLADSMVDDARTVNRTLDERGEEVFAVVAATLSTNHAAQLREIAAVRAANDDFPDRVGPALDDTERLLRQIDVGRKYFKTVYVQKELAYLSRLLLYVGVPAVLACGGALVLYNASRTATVPVEVVGGVAAAGFLLGVAPLAILFAFVLRLAWVAQRTAAIAPFRTGSEYGP